MARRLDLLRILSIRQTMDKRPLVSTLRLLVGGGFDFLVKIALGISLLASTTNLVAQTSQMDRQIYLIEAAQDYLILTYIFTIHNQKKAKRKFAWSLIFQMRLKTGYLRRV